MEPIKLTKAEQAILTQAREALLASKEQITLRAKMDTIAALHTINTPGWVFSDDYSAILPPSTMGDLNLPQPDAPDGASTEPVQ